MMKDKLCIYLVDDEDIIHESISTFIRRHYANAEIHSFYTVKEFLRALKNDGERGDLIILDHHFDVGISGSEGVSRIRDIDPYIPIIFLTGVSDDLDITYKKDANIYFKSKPISEIELKRSIRDYLEKKDTFVNLEHRVIQLEEEVKSLMEETKVAREWAYKALAKVCVEGEPSLGDPEEWSNFQNKIVSYIKSIEEKEEINFTQSGDRWRYISSVLENRYGRFDEESIKFLATGEFLFENHKDIQEIDFSPMLIAYSKCFENVLVNYLQNKGIVKEDEEPPTLGTCIYRMKDHLPMLEELQEGFAQKYKKMQAFLSFRNKAAHPQGVSKSDIEKARSYLFDREIVDEDKYLLDFVQYGL